MCTYTGSGTRYGFVVSSLILLVAGVGAGEGPRRCCQRHLDGQSNGKQSTGGGWMIECVTFFKKIAILWVTRVVND